MPRARPKARAGVDFNLKKSKRWKFFDGFNSVRPHFVLMDGQRHPRFVLGYDEAENQIIIKNVQRVSRAKRKENDGNSTGKQDRTEGEKTLEFKKALGMPPGSFLVYQFIRQRREIFNRENGMIYLPKRLLAVYPEVYGPIRNQFFRRNSIKSSSLGDLYLLDLEKPIVRQALEPE